MLPTLSALVLFAAIGITSDVQSSEPERWSDEAKPYHPEPRVIVNVLSVNGPHDPAKVQHSARFGWSRIVRCYKKTGARKSVVVAMELLVSREGNVASASGDGNDSNHQELSQCLAESLPGLSMPKAEANSKASIEIRLAPGDK
jgi:hypothetical protein